MVGNMRTVVALAMISALWMLAALPALVASAPQKPEAPGVKLPTGVISKREDPVAYLRAHPIDEHALLSNTQNMYRSDKQYYYRNQASQDRCLNNGCCCCLTEHSRNDGDKFMVDGKGKPISACQSSRSSMVHMSEGYAVVFCETKCIETINGNLLHGEGDFVNDGNICMQMCDRRNNNDDDLNK